MDNFVFLNFLTDFWVNSVIVGSIFITGIVLVFAVLQQDRRSVTNQTVAILFASIVFWILFAHLGDSGPLLKFSLLFNRIVYACLYFWAYSLFVLPFVFPTDSKVISKPIRVVLVLVTIALGAVAIFTDKFILRVDNFSWGASNIPGQWSNFFNLYMIVMMLPMLKFIWTYRRLKENALKRKQLKFFFLGLVFFLIGVLVIYLGVNSIVGDQRYYRYGNYSAIFLIAFTAYAILKHHLFNIKVILTQAAIIVINVVSAVQIASSKTLIEGVFRTIFLITIAAGSYILIQSIKREIEQKEKLAKLAKELETANDHLKEVDKLKDDFLSMASHELNTPIAAIKGYLSMILVEGMGGKIPDKARTYLDTVYTSAERLANMVKDLLNVSRIESGRIHIIWEQKPIEEIINQSITEVMSKAREAGHTLTFEAPKHKMPATWFDSTRVTEIVINMLGNSIKYTPNGGKISVRAVHDEDKVVVSVEDNGKGIPRNRQRVVFEKFSQVDVLKDEVKGTGLGMYIAKKFIELHKGKIWFHSDGEGKGTTFFFSLPILKEKPFDAHEGQDAVLH